MFTNKELKILKAISMMERSRATEHTIGINILHEEYSTLIANLNTIIMKLDKILGPDGKGGIDSEEEEEENEEEITK